MRKVSRADHTLPASPLWVLQPDGEVHHDRSGGLLPGRLGRRRCHAARHLGRGQHRFHFPYLPDIFSNRLWLNLYESVTQHENEGHMSSALCLNPSWCLVRQADICLILLTQVKTLQWGTIVSLSEKWETEAQKAKHFGQGCLVCTFSVRNVVPPKQDGFRHNLETENSFSSFPLLCSQTRCFRRRPKAINSHVSWEQRVLSQA